MIISFTGTQKGMTKFQKNELWKLFELKGITELVHGDCVGADDDANHIAYIYGVKQFSIHPPDNPKKRAFCFDEEHLTQHLRSHTNWTEKTRGYYKVNVRWFPIEPYLKRNHNIVDSSPLLIACPKEFKMEIRSGTWATIRYAWRKKKDVLIIPPIERPEE